MLNNKRRNAFLWQTASLILCVAMCAIGTAADDDSAEKKSRSFKFVYSANVIDLPANAVVKVWVPIATSNSHQKVEFKRAVAPVFMQQNSDPKYGNLIGHFVGSPVDGKFDFLVEYDVVRQEAAADQKVALTEAEKARFLQANSLVPISGAPVELIKEMEMPKEKLAMGKLLYNKVESHMKYDKSKPGYGKGDALWACDSKTGNCTDFHSLFISMARSRSIPARFEIGFPLPSDKTEGKIGGYHCWAWFHDDAQGWVPVDISEADKHPEMKDYYFGKLTPNRVAFSTGRDIELVPKNESGPLNYFVYPHVEVNGKVWPKDKIELKFEFANKPVQ